MTDMTPQKGTADKLKGVETLLGGSPSANKQVTSPIAVCDGKRKRVWHHIGIGFSVKQYDITGRKHGLKLPTLSNVGPDNAEVFNMASGGTFSQCDTQDPQPKPCKIYSPAASRGKGYFAELTMGANSLCQENVGSGEQKLTQDGRRIPNLDQSLGKALAVHFSRTRTFSVWPVYLRVSGLEEGLKKTEMMGIKMFVYVKVPLDGGKPEIRRVSNGAFHGAVVSPSEYENEKLIRSPQGPGYGGRMPLIAGVQQMHVLLQGTTSGSFSVVEVHCDGDPLPV